MGFSKSSMIYWFVGSLENIIMFIYLLKTSLNKLIIKYYLRYILRSNWNGKYQVKKKQQQTLSV